MDRHNSTVMKFNNIKPKQKYLSFKTGIIHLYKQRKILE